MKTNFKTTTINTNTTLLVPMNADIPLSHIFKQFNNQCYMLDHVIIDMLIYVGDVKSRFQCCKVQNNGITMNDCHQYLPPHSVIEKSDMLFCSMPDNVLHTAITSPIIRNRILNKKYTTNSTKQI